MITSSRLARAFAPGPLRGPVLFLAASAISLTVAASIVRAYPGRWTVPSADWSSGDNRNYAVHLALVPGDGNPYHSRVLWWHGANESDVFAGQWGWTPGNEGCASFPSANFDSLGFPNPGIDIFCGGQILMADGRLMAIGGTHPTIADYGDNRIRIFTPGAGTAAGTWDTTQTMKSWRWYAGSVALADGRIMAISGSSYRRHTYIGGRFRNGAVPASPAGDSLHRFAPIPGGAWEYSVIPDSLDPAPQPDPRESHTAIQAGFPFNGIAVFGGRKANGNALNDFWILRRATNPLGADQRYICAKRGTSNTPDERSEHSAVSALDTNMVIYGGLGQGNAVINEAPQRLFWRSGSGWEWKSYFTAGTGPGARFGHAAICDTLILPAGKRHTMLLFGGKSSTSSDPTDMTVWGLRFSPTNEDSATWIQMPQKDLQPGVPKPGPRSWQSLTWNRTPRQHSGGKWGHTAMLYGGALGGSAFSDSLWALWIFPDDTVGWQLITPGTTGSAGPGARSRHSATFDPGQGNGGRLYIFGGETASLADSFVYAVDPWQPPSPGPQWARWKDAHVALSRHTGVLDDDQTTARTPETFNSTTGQWTQQTSAPLAQRFYPPTFEVPGGASGASRVVTLSNDDTYWTDIPSNGQASAWQRMGNSAFGFFPQGGVSYLPGRLMVAGGTAADTSLTGMTKTLNTGSTENNWAASGSMARRFHHNLVIMPDGRVIAIGGVYYKAESDQATYAQKRPQIWDSATGTWTCGACSDTLAIQPTARTHHSTAILLPDGRILSAGGEAANEKGRADLYCPPYLFNADGSLATRPGTTGAPQRVRYGAPFSVCLSSAATIDSACLIRPGATTHAHDQNQRHVPLTFTQAYTPARLIATAPADSFQAPPGDYMLFVLNTNGVPSIARWIRLGYSWSESPAVEPDSIALTADFITNNSVNFTWTASGDDGTSGTASYDELRYSTSPIVTGDDWINATRVSSQPVPVCGGLGQSHLVTGLSPNANYYFAIKTSDESENMSPIGRLKVKTLSDGGGGGASARLARDEGTPAGAHGAGDPTAAARTAATVQPSAAVALGTGTGLILESTPGSNGFDVSLIPIQSESWDGYVLSASGGALVQAEGAGGVWSTQLHYDLPPGDRFALCTPEKSTRWVILEPCAVTQVLTAVRGKSSLASLEGARHSRLGEVASLLAAGSPPALLPGDTLALHYAAGGESEAPHSDWILVMDKLSASTTTSRASGYAREKSQTPVSFALRQNQPNPLSTTTRIGFDLPTASWVRLEIYDLLGRRVRALANGPYPLGEHEVLWDRRMAGGSLAGPGVYFYCIQAGPYREKRRMLVLPQ